MKILNRLQGREYNRAQKLAHFFLQQILVYPIYTPFADEVELFTANNNRLLSLVPAKDVNGQGVTVSKNTLKAMVAALGNIICTRTAAYATKIGNNDLKMAIYHRTSEIHNLKDADVLAFVTRLVDNITPLLTDKVFQTYAVSQAMLDTITSNAKDFNDCIGQADIVDDSRNFASRTINDILKSIRQNIVQFNWLLNFFEEKYPAFVEGFAKASAIDDTGIRHSGIEGIIKNSSTGSAISEVTITGEGKKKIAKTDWEGKYTLIKLKTGIMNITITAPGYNTQVIAVKIIRGKILQLDCELQAQALNMATA